MHRFARIAAATFLFSCGSAALGQTTARQPMTPAPVVMQDMTPDEEKAHMVWSLRAALNVAALQCQFSPFLATVDNYNRILRQHASEFDRARRLLVEHFKRLDKSTTQKAFDEYTTRTYNSFSTLDAQVAFCEKASLVGRQTLMTPKNALPMVAAQHVSDIRTSLIPQVDPLTVVDVTWIGMPYYLDPCVDKKGRRKARC